MISKSRVPVFLRTLLKEVEVLELPKCANLLRRSECAIFSFGFREKHVFASRWFPFSLLLFPSEYFSRLATFTPCAKFRELRDLVVSVVQCVNEGSLNEAFSPHELKKEVHYSRFPETREKSVRRIPRKNRGPNWDSRALRNRRGNRKASKWKSGSSTCECIAFSATKLSQLVRQRLGHVS